MSISAIEIYGLVKELSAKKGFALSLLNTIAVALSGIFSYKFSEILSSSGDCFFITALISSRVISR